MSRRRGLEVGAAIASLWVPVIVALVQARHVPWVPTADNALIAMRSLEVPSHFPLVGVYSRFGFHHPGPLLFLVDALPVRVLGPKGLLIATAGVNMTALAGLAVLFDRRGGRALLIGGTVVSLLTVAALSDELLNPWNPWITTLPYAFFVVAMWSVVCGDWRVLPAGAFAGSFVLQAHLGFTLLVGVLLVPVLVIAARSWWRARGERASRPENGVPRCSGRVLLVTAAVLTLVWLPPIIDQLTQDPGNVSLIIESLRDPEHEPAGPRQAWDVFSHGVGSSVPWITGQEEVEPYSNRVVGGERWTLLPVVALVAAALACAWPRRRDPAVRDALWWQGMVWCSTAIGFLSVMRITGDAYPYLVRWMWVLGAFVWSSAAWTLFVTWQARREPAAADAIEARTPADRIAAVVGVAVVLAALVFASATTAQAPVPARQDGEMVLAVVNPSFDRLRNEGVLLIRHEGGDLAEIAMGVGAELDRRGLPVVFEDVDALAVGEHRVLGGGRADATLLVATRDAAGFHLGSGEVPLAGYDELAPAERLEYEELAKRAGLQYSQILAKVPVTDPLATEQVTRLQELTPRSGRVMLFLTRP